MADGLAVHAAETTPEVMRAVIARHLDELARRA
ncbi:hypothetical protein HNR40_005026 [Nonomuraea endophytica]|uniref:Uncharacterized protein n=1 Tax=Nonomuraea endophytica TaxID=714136 RepID=A0A7W8EG69_9ACTN|nr:hypothetical protein [Nonomuraea endophytica]